MHRSNAREVWIDIMSFLTICFLFFKTRLTNSRAQENKKKHRNEPIFRSIHRKLEIKKKNQEAIAKH